MKPRGDQQGKHMWEDNQTNKHNHPAKKWDSPKPKISIKWSNAKKRRGSMKMHHTKSIQNLQGTNNESPSMWWKSHCGTSYNMRCNTSNNKVESLLVYQGLVLIKERGIKYAFVLGNSSIVIRHLQYKTTSQNVHLARLILRVQALAKEFEKI